MTDDDVRREIMTRLTVSVPVAGKALAGLGRNASYQAAKGGNIGTVPIIEIGGRKAVPTAPIRKVLGIDPDRHHG
jgi:hypothetical protein